MKQLYSLLLIVLSLTCYGQKQPWEKNLRAIDSLKKHSDGENWTFKDIDKLLLRTRSPMLGKGRDVSKTEYKITTFDFSNNQLSGSLPESFFYLDKEFVNTYETSLLFSWNQISEFSPFLGHSKFGNPAKIIKLDHNQIASFDIDNSKDIRAKTGSYTGYSLYVGTRVFVFNNNEITSLTKDNLSNDGWGTSFISNKAEEIRIDNNRLNFKSLCEVVPWIKQQYAHKGWRFPGNPDCVFTYYPQKALGDDQDAITKSAGEEIFLSFSLPHPKNVYSWQLNGMDVPLSDGKNFKFKLAASNAGVYRCKITNPELPNVTLFSKDRPVFMRKDGNKATSDISLTHNPIRANFPRLTIIGDLAATDPDKDQIYFRLPEKLANNSCFRIKEGKTLVSAEELFNRDFIEQYEIRVEAYDAYGASYQKTLTLKKDAASTNITPLPKNITLSNKKIDENLAFTVIGDLAAVGVEGYSFSLPDGIRDNNLFDIKANQLKTKRGLDYEVKDTYKIRIKAAAADGTSMLKDFDIAVNNINDKPKELIITNNGIKIGQVIRTVIGYFATVDQDKNDSQFTYNLVSDAFDNELFVIENNCLKTRIILTEEHIGEKTIKVTTQDEHEGSLTTRLVINVVENSVATHNYKITLDKQMIAENCELGTLVGKLDVSNKSGATFAFSLPDREDNAAFKLNGNDLLVNTALNFEKKSTYQLLIVAESNDISIDLSVNIHVTNVNEAPFRLGLTKMGIKDNAPVGTEIGQLVVSDPDGSDAYTFELLNSEFFVLKGDKLNVLKAISSLPELHEIQIKVSDEAGLSYTQKLNLNIKKMKSGAVNVAPVRIGLDNFLLDRTWAKGTPVATLFMKDADGDQGTFTLTAGMENFSIQGDQLVLTSFGNKNVYKIEVEATDEIETISQEFSLFVPIIVSGIDQINSKDVDVSLYPNPVSDVLNSTKNGQITIYSMNGTIVKDEAIQGSINLSDLSDGVYLVILKTADGNKSFKIIKN